MGYVPFRDNRELKSVSEDDGSKLYLLADDLEQQARQEYHRDVCHCDQGEVRFWECIYGAIFPLVSADEILGLAFARGLLKLPE
jgi:hypothetical protein